MSQVYRCHCKHFPPPEPVAAESVVEWPKPIESGPLPEGRLIFGLADFGGGFCKRQARWEGLSAIAADNQRAIGWKFYDYGPLPPQEQARG